MSTSVDYVISPPVQRDCPCCQSSELARDYIYVYLFLLKCENDRTFGWIHPTVCFPKGRMYILYQIKCKVSQRAVAALLWCAKQRDGVRTACSVAVSLTPASHQTTILGSKEWPRHLTPVDAGFTAPVWWAKCGRHGVVLVMSTGPRRLYQSAVNLLSVLLNSRTDGAEVIKVLLWTHFHRPWEIIWVYLCPEFIFPMPPPSSFVSFIEEPFDLSLIYPLLLLHYVTRQYDKLKPIKNQMFPLFLSYNIPFTPVNLQP